METEDEDCSTRQENEVEVLRSIYGDEDFRDLRNQDVWKVDRPPEIVLNVRPNHDSRGQVEATVQARLYIKVPTGYPDSRLDPGLVQVRECSGISDESVASINDKIAALLPSLPKGEVVIMELAQHVAGWLSEVLRASGPKSVAVAVFSLLLFLFSSSCVEKDEGVLLTSVVKVF